MAKTTAAQRKSAAATGAAPTISVATLPPELNTLIGHAADYLKLVAAGVVALDTAAPEEKAAIASTLEVATAGAEQSHAAIDAWFDAYVRDKKAACDEYCDAQFENRSFDLSLKLKAADAEADRQLEETRARFATTLKDYEDGLVRDLEAIKSRHTPQSDESTGGDPAVPAGPVLVVAAKVDSRWRAKRHFTRVEVRIPAADLSWEDIERIKGDELLIWRVEDVAPTT